MAGPMPGLLSLMEELYGRINKERLFGGGVRGAATRGLLGADAPENATPAEMEAYRNIANASMALAAGPVAATRAIKGAKTLKNAPQAQALETARQNAVKMLGLPESNTAMDRARAMGFEDGWYHGTFNDVQAFDIGRVKERFPYSIGIHTTNRPSEASIYAQKSPADKSTIVEGANVMPLMARRGNSMDIETKQVAASMEADLNRAQIIKDLLNAKNAGKPYDSVVIARKRGDEWDGANLITREPARLRSRFAAFDPARIDEKDLLASLAAMGITLPLTMGLLSEQTD